MKRRPRCTFLSFDYLDFDVFLNVRTFYRLAGYRISTHVSSSDLLVVLRGLPQKIYSDFYGVLHIYDYVREHVIDYRTYFPHASFIYYISLHHTLNSTQADKNIFGYLPVFPRLWVSSSSFLNKNTRPIHISNYKPMDADSYQQQLVYLIKSQQVDVYGDKWDRLDIKTNPLSYLSANNILSKSLICYGLMYPYQRGTSLSGRMWQAPIHGCRVISEVGSNIFSCPGISEISDFRLGLLIKNEDPSTLSTNSINFWTEKTLSLATDLNLSLNLNRLSREVVFTRYLLIKQHLEFGWEHIVLKKSRTMKRLLILRLKSILHA